MAAGTGLRRTCAAALIIISECEDRMRLNRMIQIPARSGYTPAYATIIDRVAATGRLIAQRYRSAEADILASDHLHADETTIMKPDDDTNQPPDAYAPIFCGRNSA